MVSPSRSTRMRHWSCLFTSHSRVGWPHHWWQWKPGIKRIITRMLHDFLLPVMNRSKSPSNHPGYTCKARSLLFTSVRSHWVYWCILMIFSFHCAKTIESLLFTSMRSNLYSSGIGARRPIIHTCLQQKSTCNLGFFTFTSSSLYSISTITSYWESN